MAVQKSPFVSSEAYLQAERQAEHKSEYHAGEIFAMAGASVGHNRINRNMGGLLYNALRGGPCEHFQNDMRVAIRNGPRFVYPDTVVVCGEQRFFDAEVDTLLNPTVIIEVMSESTEGSGTHPEGRVRGLKFLHYQQIDSLQEYLLVSQKPCRAEIFRRDSETENRAEWHYTRLEGCDALVTLTSICVTLALADVYEGVASSQTGTANE